MERKPILTEDEQEAFAKKLVALPDNPSDDALAEIDDEFQGYVFGDKP